MSNSTRPTEAELAALADGSLDAARTKRVLEQVSRSPELQAALAEQRRAVALVNAVDARAPVAVRERIEAMLPAGSRERGSASARPGLRTRSREPAVRRGWLARARLGLASGLALVVALAVVVTIGFSGGGSSASPLQQTATLTLSRATSPAPAESAAHSGTLAVSVDGVPFPYWEGRFGWRSSGARSDNVDGRAVQTVFYSHGQGRRVGYAIVSGRAWATHGGRVIWRAGVPYRLLGHDGATVVTWPRDGRLCVLSGRGVSAQTLLRLAGWSGTRA